VKLPRRNFLHLAAGAAALPAVSRFAFAQDYPTRPVRLIVGFAPAGGTDIMARLIGQWLSERLGQQFVIENRPGAASNIGTEMVVNAPPDGYTLLVATFVNAVNATLYDKLNFNFIRDIAPVASIAREPFAIEVHPSVPVKTVPEFIAYAKANPGTINMASAGVGSGNHIAGELFKMKLHSFGVAAGVTSATTRAAMVVNCRMASPAKLTARTPRRSGHRHRCVAYLCPVARIA
jgi:tripartite-type tricarboxylate transporter receptor subunit TctC